MHRPPNDYALPAFPRGAQALRPALQTLSLVSLMLGLFQGVLLLLIAWIRTPEALFISTDPLLPQVVRGGESVSAIAGWLRTELWPGVFLVVGGWAGLVGLSRRSPLPTG